jgi:glutaredoxin 2
MGFSLLGHSFDSIVVPYHDEATPIHLTGKKMLPIVKDSNGVAKNESLDILKEADKKNTLQWELLDQHEDIVNTLLDTIGSPVHSLCMPYWIWTPEFDENSRRYFQTKKEIKRGPFKDLVKNQQSFIDKLAPMLASLETELKPFYRNDKLSILDIMIASHLWGLYIVPEYQFTPNMHNYLQRVKKITHFDYHHDFWV